MAFEWHPRTAFHRDNTIPPSGWIWVFGSNLAGRHGKGAAKIAHVNFHFPYAVGEGRRGSAYAIPTKDKDLKVRDIADIAASIQAFCAHAMSTNEQFFLTRVGCVLAGYKDEEIAPLFAPLMSRGKVSFPMQWKEILSTQAP